MSGARPPAARLSGWRLAALIAIAALLIGATQLARLDRSPARVSLSASSAPPSVSPASPPPAPSVAVPLLRLSGSVPTQGTGIFAYAWKRGPVLGKSGPVRYFRVGVERGTGEDVAAFAAQVESTLGDPRSWVGDGGFRLQRVPGPGRADFTILLATRDTTSRICEAGGTNIWGPSGLYTSCRTLGRAVINLDRWRLSAATYVDAKIPLSVYRQYVINHEVGHEFGHPHEGCPNRGGPAPVMVQQTLDLRGCTPYAWPRRNGRRLVGPAL